MWLVHLSVLQEEASKTRAATTEEEGRRGKSELGLVFMLSEMIVKALFATQIALASGPR